MRTGLKELHLTFGDIVRKLNKKRHVLLEEYPSVERVHQLFLQYLEASRETTEPDGLSTPAL